ncbi:MAG: hypothetical protein ACREQ4_17205 [Candidatus Binataceae bacterium]
MTSELKHMNMWCPGWDIRNRGKASVYSFPGVVIEAESERGKLKRCRVGSALIDVLFTDIDDESEIWQVGDKGVLKVNRAGFEKIFYDGFLNMMAVPSSET